MKTKLFTITVTLLSLNSGCGGTHREIAPDQDSGSLLATPRQSGGIPSAMEEAEDMDENSAARHKGENYKDAVARIEKIIQRKTPWSISEHYKASTTVKNSQTSVAKADLSNIPVWSDEDIHSFFKHTRDMRFQTMSGFNNFQRRLTWLYPDDGCYSRAEVVKEKAADLNLSAPYKLFSFGDLQVKTSNESSGYVTWWYHVVPVVKNASDGECYVFDAAINPSGPLPWKHWLLRQVNSLDQVKVSVCDPNAYGPDSKAFGGENYSSYALANQKSSFLQKEWKRQKALGRDPYKVLGSEPPWATPAEPDTANPSACERLIKNIPQLSRGISNRRNYPQSTNWDSENNR